ncbi:unnamed protein product [Clonostachys byssicola]|uniref:Uncharacterized protein n=1 Tax=Clonostachys byssicola TaxID=160290 RepID=A0A9N9UG28_9HYPO|nr:unnamed protein product [Clonostachys byssicola]
MDAFRKNGEKLQNEVDELWRIFVTAAKQIYSHSVICVLDGLDECQEDDQKKLFQLLGSFYNTPRPVKGPQLKFLITSRPYLDIEYLFHQLPLIRLDGEECSDAISKDINLMVKDGLCKLNLRPDVQDLLENRLITPSNRTYLWAHHVLEDLRDPRHKQTKKGFEKALKSLPKPLEVEYDKILNRVKHNRRHKAEILLRIVVDAYRPLTLSELDVAFELATGGQDAQTHDDLDLGLDGASIASRLRNLCGLFIYVDDSRIFLIHQSAKEYLVNIHYPRLALDESRPHSQMVKSPNKLLANICVQYLSLKDFSYDLHDVNSNDKESFYPLLEYSAIYLADHFRQATVDDDKLSAHIYELYDDHSQRFGNWYQISQATNSFKGAPKTSLQLAAFSGHLEMVSHFLKTKEFQKDTELWNMGEALYWAALGGNEQIVNILIENGSDVNANISEPLPTPSGECDKLDFMLLDSGADDISRSLLTASSKDHLRILRLLVDNYVYLNKQAKFDVDSLSNAYAGYQKSHGRLLLDCQDTNAHFAFYGNALQAAAQGGHTGVVQLLLNRDADVNVGGGFFGNALQAAARGGHSRVVELLLERGADINAPGGFYGSGLQAAARGGHKIIAEHLLDRGADVNTSRGFFGTALQAAARVGHKKIVRLLITKYADINAQGGLYGTALHAAIAGGYEDITMLFLEKGANPYAQGGFYGSIFEAATQTHHPRIVQLLNEKGFNDAQGDHRQTRHGSFQKFDNASADMRVDGNDLPTGADLAGFDDGRREDFILRAHQTYQPHHTSPSHPHLASSAHLQNEESSRPPKKRKWRS